jgi:hypothetical protein
MTNQPEALRLADVLDAQATWVPSDPAYAMHRAAAELRRLHAANAELTECLEKKSIAIQRIWKERDEARAEALEQARLNGMGSEREARLMAQVQEARAELARLKEAIPAVLTHIDDIGARGYYSGKTLEEDAAIEVLRADVKEPK